MSMLDSETILRIISKGKVYPLSSRSLRAALTEMFTTRCRLFLTVTGDIFYWESKMTGL